MNLLPEEPSKTEAWCRGISQLIRVRGPEQYTRQDGRNIIWIVCFCIVSAYIFYYRIHRLTVSFEAFQMPNKRL